MLKIVPLIVYAISIPLQIGLGKKTCDDYKIELADKQSRFVNCVTHNSVPVNFCQKCASEYYDMVDNYENVTKCNQFFDQDRLNVILTVKEAVAGLWSKAICDGCYADRHNVTFSEKYKAYDDCTLKYNTSNDICNNCTAEYKALNDYFIILNQKSNGKVCFDFQDQMNRTRHYWSKTLNCCQREKHLTIFTSVAIIMISVVGTFYLTAFALTKYKERNYDVLSDRGMTTTNRTAVTQSTLTRSISPLTTDSATTLKLNNPNNIINDNEDSSGDDIIND